jgi:translation initiation factor 3 subunit D
MNYLRGVFSPVAFVSTFLYYFLVYTIKRTLNQLKKTRFAHTLNRRDKIDSQRGSVLANELKNNSFKLAKWTAQSLLAGADQMKIGFCSRSNPKSAYDHVILATQFYRPKDFASQITLSETQMWAMMRMFVTMFAKQEEGKYVLMREPNKAVLTLYKVPQDTFEEDE